MAVYTAHSSCTVYNTVEEAVAGVEAKIHAVDVTRLNLQSGVTPITGSQRFAGWIVYTDEA